MNDWSIFDVVGPVMVGPSSSHTAGAARIGRIVRGVIREDPIAIVLGFPPSLMQTYHGHRTDCALVGGMIGLTEEDPQLRDSLVLARSRGISVSVQPLETFPDAVDEREVHPNTMRCRVTTASGVHEVTGVSVGGGSIEVIAVDGCPTRIAGSAYELLVSLRAGPDGNASTRIEGAPGKGPTGVGRTILADLRRAGVDVADWEASEGAVWFSLVRRPDDALLRRLASRDDVHDAWLIEPITRFPRTSRAFEPPFVSLADLAALAAASRLPEAAVEHEVRRSGATPGDVRREMGRILAVMRESVSEGLSGRCRPVAGFIPGDDGYRLFKRWLEGETVTGGLLGAAVARALAVGELNSAMGRVVAAPTAGSCGVLPAVLLSVGERRGLSDDVLVDALLVAAAVGLVIAGTASFSGAVGGCQGEVGIASAMAAAAAVYACGGGTIEITHAAALALKNILGLVCDPVAAPVEVPCVKRNAIGAANALAAAEMALAGIRSVVPPDEVVQALKNVQSLMHEDLRDNTRGGLGSTPTAARLKAEWARRLACGGCGGCG